MPVDPASGSPGPPSTVDLSSRPRHPDRSRQDDSMATTAWPLTKRSPRSTAATVMNQLTPFQLLHGDGDPL